MDTTWFKSIHGLELWAILLKTQFLTFLEANYPHIYKPDDGPLADAFVVDMTAYTLALMESHSENKPEVHPLAYYVKKYYADIIRSAVGSEKPTHDDYDFILRKYTSLLKVFANNIQLTTWPIREQDITAPGFYTWIL